MGRFGRAQHGKKMDWAIPVRFPHVERVGHPQAATEPLSPTPGRALEQPQPRQERETRANPSFGHFGDGGGLLGALKSIFSHAWRENIQSRIHPAGRE